MITSAVSLLSILIEEYGLPWLQRWLDNHRPEDDDNYNVVAAGQATDDNIETSVASVVCTSWKPKQDSFKTSEMEKK